MANVSLIEQLDQAIETIIANPEAVLPNVHPRIAAQLRVAAFLRDMPHPDFKARLKADLERRAFTKMATVKPNREEFHTITPYLMVNEAEELITFVKEAFGAEELSRAIGSAGGIHCEVKIDDSIVMIGGGGTWRGTPKRTGMHLYVKDTDAVYERALQAGGVSLLEPVDQFYGDREAAVKDLSGNHWYIATHQATGHRPEGFRTVTPFLHPREAARLIEFLERAFGAEEQDRAQSPDGVIHHAIVRNGDSMIEMGEAHDAWQPMATAFYFHVNDVEAWYRRAVEAGALSQDEPADQPSGYRVAGVADPFDNVWYIATILREGGAS